MTDKNILNDSIKQESIIWSWWENRRIMFNKGLVIAMIFGVIVTALVRNYIISLYSKGDSDPFGDILMSLLVLGISNLCYYLGYVVDRLCNKGNSLRFRNRLFNVGYWFWIIVPFLFPLLIITLHITGLIRKSLH